MKEPYPALERLRFLIGVGLIAAVCFFLWRTKVRPFLESGRTNLWETGVEVRDKLIDHAHEKRMEEKRKRVLEEMKREREEKARREGGSGEGQGE